MYEQENQTTDTQAVDSENAETEANNSTTSVNFSDVQTVTVIQTPKGQINVVHEITLGDVIISTLLFVMILFIVLGRFIRG
ncbi:hypothetical protein J9303_13855 [Bacillaceae bacterium Marseille-Q3522]|nr:hypothetical protein [Bacillaceae bacterium Marseille-Q3522]